MILGNKGSPRRSQAGVIYSEGFESGTAPGWSLDGLWHVTENAPASGQFALGYVQHETPGPILDGDFDTRQQDGTSIQNHGNAIAPTILLPKGNATLYFDALSTGVTSGPGGTDSLQVNALFPLSGSGVILLAANSNNLGPPTLIPNDGTYHRIAVDISFFAGGPFTLDFFFNTGDEFFNDFPGIRIDNVEIDSAFPEPSTFVLSSIVLGTCWTFRRLKRIRTAA